MKENLFLSVEWSPVKDPASRFSVRKIVPPPKKKKRRKNEKRKAERKRVAFQAQLLPVFYPKVPCCTTY